VAVGTNLAQFFLCLVPPFDGGLQAAFPAAAFAVGKEFGMGSTQKAHAHVPAVGAFAQLVDPGNILVFFFRGYRLNDWFRYFHVFFAHFFHHFS
jgi:hypothetical protein